MPFAPPAIVRLIASFFARRTMFSIMAPDEKSLKYRISLSPFWYVTSRKRLFSSVDVHRARPRRRSSRRRPVAASPSCSFVSSSAIGSVGSR